MGGRQLDRCRRKGPHDHPALSLAAFWTFFGLASGLFYREFTKLNDHPGGTQLAVVHTHALTLGTLVMLAFLALALLLPHIGNDKRFRVGFWLWQGGLTLAIGGLLVKGCLQVLGHPMADSPMIAGFSGLGHMTLTAAFILFFLGLGRALKRRPAAGPVPGTPVAADTHENAATH
ncbi:DUF2871 domain-containing protein [Ammonicoccus fulvus]|uniref:DUF2871 domain-containing protein n=1 Tax=Ammonicoccus fulvus TaxID=3138240 RepID=A0ABZ3FMC7_9ACTN